MGNNTLLIVRLPNGKGFMVCPGYPDESRTDVPHKDATALCRYVLDQYLSAKEGLELLRGWTGEGLELAEDMPGKREVGVDVPAPKDVDPNAPAHPFLEELDRLARARASEYMVSKYVEGGEEVAREVHLQLMAQKVDKLIK